MEQSERCSHAKYKALAAQFLAAILLLSACGDSGTISTTQVPGTTVTTASPTTTETPQSTVASVTTTTALEGLPAIRQLVEIAEIGDGTVTDFELEKAAEDLAAYRQEHTDDVEALILSARVGRLLTSLDSIVVNPDDGDPFQAAVEADAPWHAFLDRAIEIEQDNAEAHYWKARLYGVKYPSIENDIYYSKYADLDSAILFAGNAVDLDPQNVPYREALAIYLSEAQRYDEALAAIKPAAGDDNPIYLLLNDLQSVPVPGEATFSTHHTQGFTDTQGLSDYGELRVRAYIVPMSGSDVEAFYQDIWPTFAWCEPSEGTFISTIEVRDETSQPVEPGVCVDDSEDTSIIVFEFRDASADDLSNVFPDGLPDNVSEDLFSLLILASYRNTSG